MLSDFKSIKNNSKKDKRKKNDFVSYTIICPFEKKERYAGWGCCISMVRTSIEFPSDDNGKGWI